MKNKKFNTQNLKPFKSCECSSEVAKRNGRKGGIRSGEVKRERKTFAEIGKQLCDCKPSNEVIKKAKNLFPEMSEKDITNKLVMIGRVATKAMSGDIKAFEILRDTIGEKPIQHNVNIEKNIDIKEEDEEDLKEAMRRYLKEND